MLALFILLFMRFLKIQTKVSAYPKAKEEIRTLVGCIGKRVKKLVETV